MSRFESDTAVNALGGGVFEVDISDGWWVVGAPNGGYLAALVARAVEAAGNEAAGNEAAGNEAAGNEAAGNETGASVDHKRIRSITFHFLRAPEPGPARVECSIERVGRSVATVTARLVQEGVVQVVALAALGATRPGPTWNDLTTPTAPDPAEVATLVGDPEAVAMAEAMGVTIGQRFELKPCLGSSQAEMSSLAGSGVATGASSAEATGGGWLRFEDLAPIDRFGLIALSDAWAPPMVHKFPDRPPVAPTVELTVHVRNEPADPHDWVLGHFSSPLAEEGYTVEDAELWDRHGRLLASARQVAVIPAL